jgi:hypothetical protein
MRRLRALGIALVVLLIGAELTLRLAWGFGTPPLYQPDPVCGYVMVPSQNIRRLGALNFINSFSMRSPEISLHKTPGVTRVLFIGDSVCYGTTYVDQSKIFTSLVAQRLGAVVHGPVEVLNASTGGWAPGNEVAYLRSRGTFDADLVIFVNNTLDLTQPFWMVDLSPNGPTPGRRPFCAIEEVLVRYLMPRISYEWQSHELDTVVEQDDCDQSKVPAMLANLDEARSICQKAHAKFAVIYTPFYDLKDRPDWNACVQMLMDWGQRRHVPILDMRDQFLTLPNSEVYIDRRHLRPGGHELIAQRVIDSWPQLMGTSSATAP